MSGTLDLHRTFTVWQENYWELSHTRSSSPRKIVHPSLEWVKNSVAHLQIQSFCFCTYLCFLIRGHILSWVAPFTMEMGVRFVFSWVGPGMEQLLLCPYRQSGRETRSTVSSFLCFTCYIQVSKHLKHQTDITCGSVCVKLVIWFSELFMFKQH